jgi:hypothetical protein
MKKKLNVTLESVGQSVDDLTEIVKTGFDNVFEKMVTKEEFHIRLDKVDERLDDIEAQVGPHSRRIDRLEDKVQKINTKLGLN